MRSCPGRWKNPRQAAHERVISVVTDKGTEKWLLTSPMDAVAGARRTPAA